MRSSGQDSGIGNGVPLMLHIPAMEDLTEQKPILCWLQPCLPASSQGIVPEMDESEETDKEYHNFHSIDKEELTDVSAGETFATIIGDSDCHGKGEGEDKFDEFDSVLDNPAVAQL